MADALPIDVWRPVFEFACVDGGFTSTSLSRVSRLIRAASAAYRFHTVRLSKLRDVQTFLGCYEAVLSSASAEKHDAPHVRHLLLSFLPGETDVILLGGSYHMRDFHSWRDGKDDWNARFVDLMSRLFALIGSHLETLTIVQSHIIPLPFVRCTLSALRELTLLEDDRMFVRLPDEPSRQEDWVELSNISFYAAGKPLDLAAVTAAPPFPCLERLYLVDGRTKRLLWRKTLPVWAKLAPRLALLRIFHARDSTVGELRDVIAANPPALPALRTLAVQPRSENPILLSALRKACSAGALEYVEAPAITSTTPTNTGLSICGGSGDSRVRCCCQYSQSVPRH
ncbi:hypothetical protein BV20DRAFT_965709 [Pilatotrama ljubarskyi]|nr:hypothetical protein BV20DRAFT_965709 [Pilatotrama ljubarskyi]